MDAHEETAEAIKYIDDAMSEFLRWLTKENYVFFFTIYFKNKNKAKRFNHNDGI